MMFKTTSVAALLLAGIMLSACGGGDGSSNTAPVLLSAPANVAGEGFVINGNPLNQSFARTGDALLNGIYAGILSFDLSGTGSVQQAVLTFHQIGSLGDPWLLGPLQVDHIDGGGTLDAADAISPALTADIASVGDQPSWTLDVTAFVLADRAAGRLTSTFRLRMNTPTDNDGGLDYMDVATSTNADPMMHPTLMVTHTLPYADIHDLTPTKLQERRDRAEAFEDLLWVLINTAEFRLRR